MLVRVYIAQSMNQRWEISMVNDKLHARSSRTLLNGCPTAIGGRLSLVDNVGEMELGLGSLRCFERSAEILTYRVR